MGFFGRSSVRPIATWQRASRHESTPAGFRAFGWLSSANLIIKRPSRRLRPSFG